ncbi:hypothetical protein H5V45_12350 [Nocardioides sp. KIGAM211]|uniref:DUF222 domain-containing protein n=1 Tax=Nocardioides luti TaxID=2761101 RepID=A0A7X0RGX2_9ACTN|nr:hypothetical protein [Nocardioides luti]MBB6628111.1 hypothetical protein [Nocardioides luti]
MAILPIDDLDAGDTLAALESGVRRRRAAEVEDLLLVAHWADLHASDPRWDPRPVPGMPRPPGSDRLVRVGGEGTPAVRELTLVELGVARSVHTLAARSTVADVLDLRHRLPRLWSLVRSLEAEPWLACKVATKSRQLSAEVVHLVDDAVAAAITGESPSRVLAIADAKVIEADLESHELRRRAEEQRRHVTLLRTDPHGLRSIVARVSAGDAVWIDATVTRVAEILASRPEHADMPRDVLRSIAMGWLARPADLLVLMLESADVPAPDAPEAPEPEDASSPSRALAVPADLLDTLRTVDPARLRPRGCVYVHVHETTLAGMSGVARVEDIGPHTLAQVRDLLAHAQVTVKPVIDLADRVSVNGYEHPEWLKERIHLLRPVDAFPHATRTSRHVDHDHPVPYDPNGPPGQTHSHTSQPLGRTAHRAKTHLGYTATPLPTGEIVWRTPNGCFRIVDHTGTHPLDEADYRALVGDDPDEP